MRWAHACAWSTRSDWAATACTMAACPAIPPIDGLAESGFLTNEQAFDLMHLPPTLTVVGGGPIGCELAQAFARLGSQVTIVQGPERLLPKEDPEVSQAIAETFAREGIRVITGARM